MNLNYLETQNQNMNLNYLEIQTEIEIYIAYNPKELYEPIKTVNQVLNEIR
jgi:hypothetical protein